MLQKYNSRNNYKQQIIKAVSFVLTAFFVLQYINNNMAETLVISFLACFSCFAPNVELFHYTGKYSDGKKEKIISNLIHIFVPIVSGILYFLFQNSTPHIILAFKFLFALFLSFSLKCSSSVKLWIFSALFPFWFLLFNRCLNGEFLSFFDIFFYPHNFDSFKVLYINNFVVAEGVQILNILNLSCIYALSFLFCNIFGQQFGSGFFSAIYYSLLSFSFIFKEATYKNLTFKNISYIRSLPETIKNIDFLNISMNLIIAVLSIVIFACYYRFSFKKHSGVLFKRNRIINWVFIIFIACLILIIELFAPYLIISSILI